MKIFVKPRKSLTRFSIRKKKKSLVRNRKVYNFSTAKSVGIFFDCNDTESLGKIRHFCNRLEYNKIKTEILCYINSDEVPGELLLWDACNVLSNSDLDWKFRPKDQIAEDFIAKKFDILFDLSLSDHITSSYIISLSSAQFKVGKFREGENDLDMMINIEQDNSVKYLLEQVINYVSMLNKSE
ncbi:MAG: hypothetical protein KAS71_10555 [Bacteroidales bacterium]|nr:hypothetical protein [Bacteroidales bacterium]